MWQIALAARVSKYGLTLRQAMWKTPAAVINQLIIYDELAAGNKPRWAGTGEQTAQDLDALMADALTAPG